MPTSLQSPPAVTRWLSLVITVLLAAGLWAVGQTASAATWTVQAKDFAFTPPALTVAVGDTVVWRNGDAESHAVQGGSLTSPEIPAGGSFSATFNAPEELTYFCRFHTYMTGTIRVVEGGGAPVATTPATSTPTTSPKTAAPTTAPARTTPPASTAAAAATTGVKWPSGATFQQVPDDPSARRPPGASGASGAPAEVSAAAAPPAASPTPTPTTTRRATSTTTTTTTAAAPTFQEVATDPAAAHSPVQLASAEAAASSPPATGDGTVLAAARESGGVKEFRLTMDETTLEVSPGVVKPAYAFNGTVPGPTIRVNEGDRVRILVDNQLPFATSTHWHGMVLPNDQDGVGGITQPHIEPGGQHVYEWTAVATGTHWYHAHSSGRHIGKGLFGGLQVVPKEDEIDSDRDYLLMLGDTDLGFTLNGRSFPSTPTLPAVVGETVRLRLVNTGDQVHAMHLHGVPFQVVAQDGMRRLKAESMDTLTIAPGQTYDLLFEQVHPGKWLLHCHMFGHSHVNEDAHPPGDSGMAGMAAMFDVTPSAQSPTLLSLPIGGISTSQTAVGGLLGLLVLTGVAVAGFAARRRLS